MSRDSAGDRRLSNEERPTRAYHVSPSANRGSIRRHGLDWSRMAAAPGLASGRTVPEEPAVFLASGPGEARFFAGMPRSREPVDIWAVRTEGLDLFVRVEGWVYCPCVISPDRLDPVEVRRTQGI